LNDIDFSDDIWNTFEIKSFNQEGPNGATAGFVATRPDTAIAHSSSTGTGGRFARSSASAIAGR
jgi:hypothetical protein